MKTFFKILLTSILILILLLVGMLYTVNVNKYKTIFEDQLSKILGMNVKINGPMKINLFPNPHVNLNNVNIVLDLEKNNTLSLTINDLFLEISWDAFYEETMTIKALNAKDINLKYIENLKARTIKIDTIGAKLVSSFQHLKVPSFTAAYEDIKIKGNLDISFDQNKININGTLKLPKYDVLLPTEKIEATHDFLKKLYQYLNLRDTKANLTIIIDKLRYDDKDFDKAHFKVDLNNKIFNVDFSAKSKDEYMGNVILKQNANAVPQIHTIFTILGEDKKKKLMGEVDLLLSLPIPTVSAKFDFQEWILPNLIQNAPQNRIFPSTPIAVDLFSKFKGEIQLAIETVKCQRATFSKVEAKVNSTPVNVLIQAKAKINEGLLVANLKLRDHTKTDYIIFADIHLQNAMASEFIKIFDEKATIAGGQLDINLKGHTHGNTIAAWMANLSGNTTLHLTNMTLLNQSIDARYVDAFAAFLKFFQAKESDTTLDCVAWQLDLNKGIASSHESIALETNEIYALGSGILDLSTESLNFTFDLRPRSELNLEIGALDNVVHLEGTLADMKIVSSPAGLIREGGTIALGIATGGVSLLAEKLLKMATKRSSPCQEVLQR